MDAVQIGTQTPATDAEGFLIDPRTWTRELGLVTAGSLGIAMDPDRWKIVETARAEWGESGASPGLRKLSKKTGFPMKTFYDLFPDGPAKKIAKVAGIPKPKSCL